MKSGLVVLLLYLLLLLQEYVQSHDELVDSGNTTKLMIFNLTVSKYPYHEIKDLTREELYERYESEKNLVDLRDCRLYFPIVSNQSDIIVDYVKYTEQFEESNFANTFEYCRAIEWERCEEFRRFVITDCYSEIKRVSWVVSWVTGSRVNDDITTISSHTQMLKFCVEPEQMLNKVDAICRQYEYDIDACNSFKFELYGTTKRCDRNHQRNGGDSGVLVSVGFNIPVVDYRQLYISKQLQDKKLKSPPQCGDFHKRLLISHHKTGSTFAFELHGAIQQIFCSSCWVDMTYRWNGKLLTRSQLNDAMVVHFIRNPWDIILSGYFYHKTCGEFFILVPMNTISILLNNDMLPSDERWQLSSIQKVYDYILNQSSHYPDPANFSYQAYLKEISSQLGIKLEYVRSLHSTLIEIVQDIMVLREVTGEDMQAADNISSLDETRKTIVSNVCMSSIMTTTVHGPTNDWQSIRRIVDSYLNIPLTADSETKLALSFFGKDSYDNLQNHSTSRGEIRLELLKVLKEFDMLHENGRVVALFESIIDCPSEYGFDV